MILNWILFIYCSFNVVVYVRIINTHPSGLPTYGYTFLLILNAALVILIGEAILKKRKWL